MGERSTLIKPPPEDPNKAPIENVLEITELAVLGPVRTYPLDQPVDQAGSSCFPTDSLSQNIFTNTRKPWQPPGARGIYGGTVIAMSLAASQRTVPDDFTVHSCHCYFLLAGSDELPILFHVENVRDGRSFATRTVQARQKDRCISTTTISFVRDGSGGPPGSQVSHASPMPVGKRDGAPLRPPPDDHEFDGDGDGDGDGKGESEGRLVSPGPFQNSRIEILNRDSPHPHEKKTHQWFRARGAISAEGGHRAHLNALAYVSDSYFIGTVSRIHNLWRFPFRVQDAAHLEPRVREYARRLNDWEGMGDSLDAMSGRPAIGMMVSLDHSIYFHEPRRVRADDWLFSEMESPWAGDGRGVVTQRIFSQDGTLLATCVQEVKFSPRNTLFFSVFSLPLFSPLNINLLRV